MMEKYRWGKREVGGFIINIQTIYDTILDTLFPGFWTRICLYGTCIQKSIFFWFDNTYYQFICLWFCFSCHTLSQSYKMNYHCSTIKINHIYTDRCNIFYSMKLFLYNCRFSRSKSWLCNCTKSYRNHIRHISCLCIISFTGIAE